MKISDLLNMNSLDELHDWLIENQDNYILVKNNNDWKSFTNSETLLIDHEENELITELEKWKREFMVLLVAFQKNASETFLINEKNRKQIEHSENFYRKNYDRN